MDLSGARLSRADLSGTTLFEADLSGASLHRANLSGASLHRVNLSGADLTLADLSGVVYEAQGMPLASGAALATNLSSMTYESTPSGLVQLRKTFKDGGHHRQERQITYVIKRTAREKALNSGSLYGIIGGSLNLVLFEWPCQYGMSPERPLLILSWLILIFSIPYTRAIETRGKDGVWKVWQPERIRRDKGERKPVRVVESGFRAGCLGLYFSLL
jgi:hypothetical protein